MQHPWSARRANFEIVRSCRNFKEIARIREGEAADQHIAALNGNIDGRSIGRGVDHTDSGHLVGGRSDVAEIHLEDCRLISRECTDRGHFSPRPGRVQLPRQ